MARRQRLPDEGGWELSYNSEGKQTWRVLHFLIDSERLNNCMAESNVNPLLSREDAKSSIALVALGSAVAI